MSKQKQAPTIKTYILKYRVMKGGMFPVGTVVTITDDYYGVGDKTGRNTSFTVVEGKLKGKKGCVPSGLSEFLIDDTPKNRKLTQKYLKESDRIMRLASELARSWANVPSSEL